MTSVPKMISKFAVVKNVERRNEKTTIRITHASRRPYLLPRSETEILPSRCATAGGAAPATSAWPTSVRFTRLYL